MEQPLISYDPAFMMDRKVGPVGMPEAGLPLLGERLETAKARLLQRHGSGGAAFLSLPDGRSAAASAQKLARAMQRRFRTLVVCGIGGSDLGARALIKALAVPGKGMEIRFIGANTDPDEIAALLAAVDWRRTAVNVISKSGDTLETMATFLALRDALIRKVGAKRHAAHVVATVDPGSGALAAVAEREGYAVLPVPRAVGGRWSALSAVGLFPAACAGIPAGRLLAGAGSVRDSFRSGRVASNPAALFAGLQAEACERRGQSVTVLMPYGESLREFAFWFRQLWAESLGKDGKGFTPVAALGAADQHSQLQLYHDGPVDKTVTFLEVAKFRSQLRVPRAFTDIPALAWMGGRRFSDLIHAEREATARALAAAGRPNGTIRVPAVTPEAMGGLMMHFMIATALAAELTGVDAYDQPGVESGKRLIKEILA